VHLQLTGLKTSLAAALAALPCLRRAGLCVIGLQTAAKPASGALPYTPDTLPTDVCWAHLAQLGSRLTLLSLSVDLSHVSSAVQPGGQLVLAQLAALTGLRQLHLHLRFPCEHAVEALQPLHTLPALARLGMEGAEAPWQGCSALTHLDIKGASLAWESELAAPHSAASLRHLRLLQCRLKDWDWEELVGFRDTLWELTALTSLVIIDFGTEPVPAEEISNLR
jgi:hypothetical protein